MSEANLAPAPARNNRRPLPADNNGISALMANVTRVEAVCHTIELWFPAVLPKLEELRRRQGQWLQFEKCEREDGSMWGHRLPINAPARDALRILDDFIWAHKATVSRFDFAYNFFADVAADREALADYFTRHGILLWNRSRAMHDEQHGVYWVSLVGRGGRQTPRGLLVYSDDPAKGCHLELRAFGTTSVRRQGVNIPSDILALNPASHLKRHFRLVEPFEDERDQLIRSLQRHAVAEDRRSAIIELRTDKPSFRERYRAALPQRMANYVRHLCPNDRAAEYHRYFKLAMRAVDLSILRVPETLTFSDGFAC